MTFFCSIGLKVVISTKICFNIKALNQQKSKFAKQYFCVLKENVINLLSTLEMVTIKFLNCFITTIFANLKITIRLPLLLNFIDPQNFL